MALDDTLERLLTAWRAGDPRALDALVEHLYDTLKKWVRRAFASERDRDMLDTTDLLHDLYLELRRLKTAPGCTPEEFMRFAVRIVRNNLTDRARKARSIKAGGRLQFTTFSEADLKGDDGASGHVLDVIDVSRALDRIQKIDPDLATHIELRIFFEMDQREVAAALGRSRSGVQREWSLAKRLFLRELDAAQAEGSADG